MAQGDIIQMIPTGSVYMFPVNSVLPGYLECNGATVSRTTYAALFAVIGITYGAGDGSTTFSLPDLRGEFVRGWDNGKGTDSGREIGTNQGQDTKLNGITASSNSTGAHTHSLEKYTETGGDMTSTNEGKNLDISSAYDNGTWSWSSALGSVYRIITAGAHSHTITLDDSGNTETRPRNVALMYCIKT